MKSPRGMPLVLTVRPNAWTKSMVTVENYVKWYSLIVVHPAGELVEPRIEAVDFPDMGDYERLGSPYLDHVPNPRHVIKWAESKGYAIDECSLDMMWGRWVQEGAGSCELARNYETPEDSPVTGQSTKEGSK